MLRHEGGGDVASAAQVLRQRHPHDGLDQEVRQGVWRAHAAARNAAAPSATTTERRGGSSGKGWSERWCAPRLSRRSRAPAATSRAATSTGAGPYGRFQAVDLGDEAGEAGAVAHHPRVAGHGLAEPGEGGVGQIGEGLCGERPAWPDRASPPPPLPPERHRRRLPAMSSTPAGWRRGRRWRPPPPPRKGRGARWLRACRPRPRPCDNAPPEPPAWAARGGSIPAAMAAANTAGNSSGKCAPIAFVASRNTGRPALSSAWMAWATTSRGASSPRAS